MKNPIPLWLSEEAVEEILDLLQDNLRDLAEQIDDATPQGPLDKMLRDKSKRIDRIWQAITLQRARHIEQQEILEATRRPLSSRATQPTIVRGAHTRR